ncbi:hypothetical protein L596_025210 [Steinernema carpocapsae]|uniref:Endonuclease/exonuclease/phosphatase domain-containing protein n=1 Tax=Steinernema carpocapsae TaxID=34508 RepID=A0A4U5M748_STECR|nr:hypothetical protein L596_025210 [Steinernema carpocapsae]
MMIENFKNFRLARLVALIKMAAHRATGQQGPPSPLNRSTINGPHLVPEKKVLMLPFTKGRAKEQNVAVIFEFLTSVGLSRTGRIQMRIEKPLEALATEINVKTKKMVDSYSDAAKIGQQSFFKILDGTPQQYKRMPTLGAILKDNGMYRHAMVAGEVFEVVKSPPDISQLTINFTNRVGMVLMPNLAAEDFKKVERFSWWTGNPVNGELPPMVREDGKLAILGWQEIGSKCFLEVHPELLGQRIALLADLGVRGIAKGHLHSSEVQPALDPNFIFAERQLQCQDRAPKDMLRIVTYNVLANLYVKPKANRKNFFPYCNLAEKLDNVRWPMLLKELKGYNADLIFLQEVDQKFYSVYMRPFLLSLGFDCRFDPKLDKKDVSIGEGLVFAWRLDKLKLLQHKAERLARYINEPENEDIRGMLKKDFELNEMLTKRTTICMVAALKEKATGMVLLAANTHLFFDPQHADTKTLQAVMCSRLIAGLKQKLLMLTDRQSIRTIFAGDFNSIPGSAVHSYFATGTVAADNDCWNASKPAKGFEMEVGTSYRSLCGIPVTNFCEYTNKEGEKEGFTGCLDYIWGCEGVEVVEEIPMPAEELTSRYVALPSKIAPSDHVALACVVRLRREDQPKKATS